MGILVCPSCAKKLKASLEMLGRNVRCPACQHVFAVTQIAEAPGAETPEQSQGVTQRPRQNLPPAPPPEPEPRYEERLPLEQRPSDDQDDWSRPARRDRPWSRRGSRYEYEDDEDDDE